MNQESVFEAVTEIITKELQLAQGQDINFDTKFIEIGVDSIALMSVFILLEERFAFETGEDALVSDSFNTVGDIVMYILSKS